MNLKNFYNEYNNIKNDIKSFNSITITHDKEKYSDKYKTYIKTINNSITNFINNFYFIDLKFSNIFYYKLINNKFNNEYNYNQLITDLKFNNVNSISLNDIIKINLTEEQKNNLTYNLQYLVRHNDIMNELIKFYEINYDKNNFFNFLLIIQDNILKNINELIELINSDDELKYLNITKNNFDIILNDDNIFEWFYNNIQYIYNYLHQNNVIEQYYEYFKHSNVKFELIFKIDNIQQKQLEKIYHYNEIYILYCIINITNSIYEYECFTFNKLSIELKNFFYKIFIFNLNKLFIPDDMNEYFNNHMDINKKYYGYFNGLITSYNLSNNDETILDIYIPFNNDNFSYLVSKIPLDFIQDGLYNILINNKSINFQYNIDFYDDRNYDIFLKKPSKINKNYNYQLTTIKKQDNDDLFNETNINQNNNLDYYNLNSYNSFKISSFYTISQNLSINKNKNIFSTSKLKKNITLYIKFDKYYNIGNIDNVNNNNDNDNDNDLSFYFYKSYQGNLINIICKNKNYNNDYFDKYQLNTKTNTYEFKFIKLKYIIDNLINDLYIKYIYPWNNNEYIKQLNRLLLLLIFEKEYNIYELNNYNYIKNILNNILKNNTYNIEENKLNDNIKNIISILILENNKKYIIDNNIYLQYINNLIITLRNYKIIYEFFKTIKLDFNIFNNINI